MKRYWIVLDTDIPLAENESGDTLVSINDANGNTFVCEAVEIILSNGGKKDDSA
mgnify:CR=1 FL=1